MSIKLYMLNWLKNQGKGGNTPTGDYNTKLEATGITSLSYYSNLEMLVRKIDVSEIDFSSMTNISYLFHNSQNLEEINGQMIANTTDFNYVFNDCRKLKKIDLTKVNTKNATNFQYAFYNCTLLETLIFGNNFTLESVVNNHGLDNMLYNCNELNDDSLNNLLGLLLTATSYTGAKKLSQLGLPSSLRTKCTTLSNWSACENAGWVTG